MPFTMQEKFELLKTLYPEQTKGYPRKFNFEIECMLCGKKSNCEVNVSKNNTAWNVVTELRFHHKNGDANDNRIENRILVCKFCHNRMHDFFILERWLKRINKTYQHLKDLCGDVSKGKPMKRFDWM